MEALFRRSFAGQILRFLTGNKILRYQEEAPGFKIPDAYRLDAPTLPQSEEPTCEHLPSVPENREDEASSDSSSECSQEQTDPGALELAQTVTSRTEGSVQMRRLETITQLQTVSTREDLANAFRAAAEKEETRDTAVTAIEPKKTTDGIVLVYWYTTADPDNPQNWSTGYKCFVVGQI
jgi:DHA1 family multidrug resistance protein-like MFS transporter